MAKKKCHHGRTEYYCMDCKGGGTCEHKPKMYYCSICKGGGTCEHKSCRYNCVTCKGGGICKHDRQRSTCKICKGSGICKHDRQKSTCKICKGRGICKHDKGKSGCKICKGSGICKHNRQKSGCKICKGSSICKHNRQRATCKICKGSGICKHNRQRSVCKICKGGSICKHNEVRSICVKCRPSRACKLCKYIHVRKSSRYSPYCFNCYCYSNPYDDISRRHKTKESYFVEFLKDMFPDDKFILNKAIDGGNSHKRPDVKLDCGTYTIIIECDEKSHSGYTCETKRIMEIFQDLENKPLIVLRFNPDNFEGKSCFRMRKGIFGLNRREWKRRTTSLSERLEFHKNNIPKKELTVEYLFYSKKI